jgi:riboflavin kinase/FMN adenylyltransferase
VVEQAQQLGGTSLVFTFQSHPLGTLAPDKCPPRLTTLEEKIELLQRIDVQILVSIPFTIELANQSAKEFLKQTIYQTIHPTEIIVGHDYAFGYRRQGTVGLLQQMRSQYGYRVQVMDAVQVGGVICSSTLIREKVNQGQIEAANQFLGRVYSITAQVVSGSQKGKGLGYPTATLLQQPKLVPAVGVYAVWVSLKGQIFSGVANIGYQPTYGQHPHRIEVHILDFKDDIYGERLRVGFVARLRDEVAFASERELKSQIEKDLKATRQVLAQSPTLGT